jgi:ABC-type uncharacterized transport system substrate-binding protein
MIEVFFNDTIPIIYVIVTSRVCSKFWKQSDPSEALITTK